MADEPIRREISETFFWSCDVNVLVEVPVSVGHVFADTPYIQLRVGRKCFYGFMHSADTIPSHLFSSSSSECHGHDKLTPNRVPVKRLPMAKFQRAKISTS